jgi:predicted ester cyclase
VTAPVADPRSTAPGGRAAPGTEDASRNAAVARRLYRELWGECRYEVADELFHPDFTYAALPGLRGGAAKVAAVRSYHTTFPDLEVVVEELVAGADGVAARVSFSGTDTGGLRGRPPTGRHVRAWTVDFLRFRDGLVISDWVGADWLGVFVQLGIVTDPWPTA